VSEQDLNSMGQTELLNLRNAIDRRLARKSPIDHGQCLANFAGLVAEVLTEREGLDLDLAYSASVTIANALNAHPEVLRNLLNSIDQL
jgi:hypothetical protein